MTRNTRVFILTTLTTSDLYRSSERTYMVIRVVRPFPGCFLFFLARFIAIIDEGEGVGFHWKVAFFLYYPHLLPPTYTISSCDGVQRHLYPSHHRILFSSAFHPPTDDSSHTLHLQIPFL